LAPEPESEAPGSWTILIPGTDWQRHGGWGSENHLFRSSPADSDGICAAGCTVLLDWAPSGNRQRYRMAAAEKLCRLVSDHRFQPGEKLHMIAHSHGGNVALAASRMGLDHPIDTLITLNKPTRRGRHYLPGRGIGSFYNISARNDWMQWAGSDARLSRGWHIDRHAVNHMVDVSSSQLRAHGALIWDDDLRAQWWKWFEGRRHRAAAQVSEANSEPTWDQERVASHGLDAMSGACG
jgi:hypothetical protein